jgi:UDP-N-acetylmuramyl pentapeptide phosphotransferase/UDP-N-acetylglucosamine-1-phosphate transferase
MATNWGAAIAPLAALGGTLWLTAVVLGWLRRRAILDHPVHRSSHRQPVPRGGGLAVMPVLAVVWLALDLLGRAPPGTALIAGIAAVLALISWFDDLSDLPAGTRFLAHVAAAALGVVAFAPEPVFQGLLPPLLDRAAAVFLWVWFVNLYNFMDGIDGITGSETACLGVGIAAVIAAAGGTANQGAWPALCVAAAGLGFLRWNWHPAKIFLGDVGSVPLGYLIGWLLLGLAQKGLWAPALILPLYYLGDATLTLLRRICRGERFWQAHREHFYQRALAPDGDHAAVMRIILAGNLVLIALALLAVPHPAVALGLAMLAVAGTLALLERRARRPARAATGAAG